MTPFTYLAGCPVAVVFGHRTVKGTLAVIGRRWLRVGETFVRADAVQSVRLLWWSEIRHLQIMEALDPQKEKPQ